MLTAAQSLLPRNVAAFLDVLRRSGSTDIVVVGGAVRDFLLQRPSRDIDIAARLACGPPTDLRVYQRLPRQRILPCVWKRLHALAREIHCAQRDFHFAIPFCGTKLDLLGLIPVCDTHGKVYPDVFVDGNECVFTAHPELTINLLTMDANGCIGPEPGMGDLERGIACLNKAPLPLRLRQVFRTLRFTAELNLTLEEQSRELLIHALRTLTEQDFESQLREYECAHTLRRLRRIHGTSGKTDGSAETLDWLIQIVKKAKVCKRVAKS